jgi:hypothetical protein
MRKNQKLGLVAVAFLAAGFGSWYLVNSGQSQANASASLELNKSMQERLNKQRELANLPTPAGPSKVEKALKGRWDHLGEDILTTPAVEADGTVVYFDKELVVGVNGAGEPIYAQGAHRLFKMNGPTMKSFPREPTLVTKQNVEIGNSFYMKALKEGGMLDRDNRPTGTKSPAGQ